MSQTFSLVCHETQQQIWIGQGRGGEMTVLYSGHEDIMQELKRFLVATKGHPLVLLCNDTEEGPWQEYEEFDGSHES